MHLSGQWSEHSNNTLLQQLLSITRTLSYHPNIQVKWIQMNQTLSLSQQRVYTFFFFIYMKPKQLIYHRNMDAKLSCILWHVPQRDHVGFLFIDEL